MPPFGPICRVSLEFRTWVPAFGSLDAAVLGAAPTRASGGAAGALGTCKPSFALNRASTLPSLPPSERTALLPTACIMLEIGWMIVRAMKAASKAWLSASPAVPLTMPAAVDGTTVVTIARMTLLATRFRSRGQFMGAEQTFVMIDDGGPAPRPENQGRVVVAGAQAATNALFH